MNSTAIEQPVMLAIYSARCTNSLNLPPATEIYPASPLISGQFLPARRKRPRRRGHSSRSFEWLVYSNQLRWGPAWWQQIQSCQGCFFLQAIEYLPDHHRVFSAIAPGMALPPTSLWSNTGDDFYRTAAFAAGFNIDIEYSLQSLGPGLLPGMACMPVLQEQKPVIDTRRSAGVCSGVWVLLPWPRRAGVTRARYLLWGANTP